jgi:hypothetical protein
LGDDIGGMAVHIAARVGARAIAGGGVAGQCPLFALEREPA